jgi:hypothetical protein
VTRPPEKKDASSSIFDSAKRIENAFQGESDGGNFGHNVARAGGLGQLPREPPRASPGNALQQFFVKIFLIHEQK